MFVIIIVTLLFAWFLSSQKHRWPRVGPPSQVMFTLRLFNFIGDRLYLPFFGVNMVTPDLVKLYRS
jgi:hypothetical protein